MALASASNLTLLTLPTCPCRGQEDDGSTIPLLHAPTSLFRLAFLSERVHQFLSIISSSISPAGRKQSPHREVSIGPYARPVGALPAPGRRQGYYHRLWCHRAVTSVQQHQNNKAYRKSSTNGCTIVLPLPGIIYRIRCYKGFHT